MQASTTTKPPDTRPLEQQALALIGNVLPARITTPEQYETLALELKSVNAWLGAWNGHHDPLIASANTTHKLALAAKAKYGAPAEAKKKTIAQLLGTYDAAQRLLAQQEADRKRRIQEAADRERRDSEIREAQERRDAAQREQKRLDDEAAAARQLVKDTDDLEQQAELLDIAENADRAAIDNAMAAGYEAQAVEQLIAAPIAPAFVEVSVQTPQVEGVSTRVTWFAEVVDGEKYLAHLLANYARNRALIAAMIEKAAMPALNREAVSTKQEIEIAPGVFARPKYGASAKA